MKIQPNETESEQSENKPSARFNLQLPKTSESTEKDREPSSNQISKESDESKRKALNENDEPEFFLEGIVMASEPQYSFAVINGRIVRVGGTVEGATIVKITKRYVVIRYAKDGSETELALR
jgi:type II secretory pathway component PulC